MASIKYRSNDLVWFMPTPDSLTEAFAFGLSAASKKWKEKWIELPSERISLMPLVDQRMTSIVRSGHREYKTSNIFIGDICSLTRESVEGVSFMSTFFRVYGKIKEYNGVNLNSFILMEVTLTDDGKVIEGVNVDGRRKFSIPPSMCKLLGITYQPGLELWPIDTNLKKVNLEKMAEKMVDYSNLSTYPTSYIDGTIRKIILELDGFSSYNNDKIITPTGKMLNTNDFLRTLTIYSKKNVATDNGCAGLMYGEKLNFKVLRAVDSGICDDKHRMLVELELTKKAVNTSTDDGKIGVSPTALENCDIDELIGVKWDEGEYHTETYSPSTTTTRQMKWLEEQKKLMKQIDDLSDDVDELIRKFSL